MKITSFLFFILSLLIVACNPDNDPDCEINVVQNTFSGDIYLDPDKEDPSADFEGNNDSGTYTFEWCNPQSRASVNFDITTTAGGSVRIVLRDENGQIVLDKSRPDGEEDSFSGVSGNGESGTWTVEVILTDINGEGSWSLHPGE